MSYMFEVYYRPPADPSKESALAERVSSFGGRLDYREAPGMGEPGGVCLTFEFEDWGRALAAAEALRQQGEHVEGPADYGPSPCLISFPAGEESHVIRDHSDESSPQASSMQAGHMARFELYKDLNGEYRWRFISTNGRVLAESGEGYKNEADCQHGIDLIKGEVPAARVELVVA